MKAHLEYFQARLSVTGMKYAKTAESFRKIADYAAGDLGPAAAGD